MLPGPVSKATTSSGARPAGITVMLAMPPMLSATRVRRAMAEQQVVDERNQRRALAAGGDVARAEIGDHRDAGALGEHRRFADLQRVGAAFVIDGLAVAADQLHRSVAAARRVSTARAYSSPSRKFRREMAAVWSWLFETPRMALAHRVGVRRRREADRLDAAAPRSRRWRRRCRRATCRS